LIQLLLVVPAIRIRGLGGRRAALDWREHGRLLAHRAAAYIRSAPLTYIYLFVLLITTWALRTASASVGKRLLLEQSTNLHHLGRDPVRVLVASAFWLPSSEQLLLWLLLFTLIMAPVERWIGSARTGLVFALGHVGATLITAAGLWLAVDFELVARQVSHAVDVGVSYGFFAVAALLVFRFSGKQRVLYTALLVGFLAIAVAVGPNFTDFGHIAALALGLLVAPFVIPSRARSAEAERC
jgi:hypothetical protein